jgi:PPOX class probable F420-dependent enzyme
MTTIPESHKDLLERPIVVGLITVMPDGQPQASPVWFNYDGSHVLVNTARGRQKDRNLTARPQVTLLFIDPENPYRYMEIRGKVDASTEEGALEHINSLCFRYTGNDDYYGSMGADPGTQTRVTYKIKPEHVVTM